MIAATINVHSAGVVLDEGKCGVIVTRWALAGRALCKDVHSQTPGLALEAAALLPHTLRAWHRDW